MHGLLDNFPKWIEKETPRNDIILCSIVILHRNLPNYSFPIKLNASYREQVSSILNSLINLLFDEKMLVFHQNDITAIEKEILKERLLTGTQGDYGQVLLNEAQDLSILLNEEDHLNMRLITPGLDDTFPYRLEDTLCRLDGEERWVRHSQYGFLTSRLENLGLGIKIQLKAHLPALVITDRLKTLKQRWSSKRIRWNSFLNSGEIFGNLFTITMMQSLGLSIKELWYNLSQLATDLFEQELTARRLFLKEAELQTEDNVYRAYATLKNARLISFDEAINLLSAVRFGVSTKLLQETNIARCNKALFAIFPGFIRRKHGPILKQESEDYQRAKILRSILS